MNVQVTIRRIDAGARAGDAALATATTEAQVNQAIAGRDIIVDNAEVTEAQLRGICHYVRSCATGLDTSSIETAISAVI